MEQQPQSSSEPPSISQPSETSLVGRMINVFVSPTELFDEIRVGQHWPVNWLVPLVISMIVSSVSFFIMFSQPGVVQSMREVYEAQFQKSVQSGQMSQAQVDSSIDMIQKWMAPMMAANGLFMTAVVFFILAAVVFFFGRVVFKSEMRFTQAMEVTSMAGLISVLGTILGTLLTVIYGKMGMTPGVILLIGQYDPKNKLHIILSVLNLVSLWYIAVLALGLSRVSCGSWVKAALLLFGVWALFSLGPALVFAPK